MTRSKAYALVRWFACCGNRYVHSHLGHIDRVRLSEDRNYGLKLFLFAWAFERAGAPRAYRIAAVKAISSVANSQTKLSTLFKKFCHGKTNSKLNPILDPAVEKLSVPAIVQKVREGALEKACQALDLRGVGPKIRAFFLRDLVTLLEAEQNLANNAQALVLCQPIDVWVRFALQELCGAETSLAIPKSLRKLGLNSRDASAAVRIVELSREAGVSPLKVNQGIWYFSAYAVADENRLRQLIRSGQAEALDEELRLMAGFLPAQPPWS